jgi:hypothetical protein
MTHRLDLKIQAQPDDSTCGQTCLHAVYSYFGLDVPLDELIREVPSLSEGGTLAVMLGIDAIRRGFTATLLTYNLMVFDPSWFEEGGPDLVARLRARQAASKDAKLRFAITEYVRFLELGGKLRFEDLTPRVLRRYLAKRIPVLTGLSATWLYRTPREIVENGKLRYEDVRGEPQGHFVVLAGYDPVTQHALVADPLRPNPFGADPVYAVELPRLLCSILLGIVTYDANLLVIRPRSREFPECHAHPPDRRLD